MVMRNKVLSAFASRAGIETEEAELALHEYTSLNDFFTRKLRHGVRSTTPGNDTLTSPADGYLTTCGRIEQGMAIQAKGMKYPISELIQDEQAAQRLNDGFFATVYLTPRHYHRVHTPASGTITEARVVPGTLYPVFPEAAKRIPKLFIRNERLNIKIQTESGLLYVIMVGASNVGSISASFDADIQTNRIFRRLSRIHKTYDPPIEIEKGDELGMFNLGSTVVLLWNDSSMVPDESLCSTEVRLGQTIATRNEEQTNGR